MQRTPELIITAIGTNDHDLAAAEAITDGGVDGNTTDFTAVHKIIRLATFYRRQAVLFDQLASKLSEAGAEAEKLSHEAPPASQPALKKIADSARDGQKKLRDIARGGV